MKDILGNALIGIVTLLALGFLGLQGFNLLKSFVETPHEEVHHPEEITEGLSQIEFGQYVFVNSGCMGCHNIDLQGGVLGPSLSNVALRHNADALREMIVNPEENYPGTYMPSFTHLEHEEVEALVVYLGSLGPSAEVADNAGTETIEIPLDDKGDPRFTISEVNQGRKIFMSMNCIGCHTINGTTAAGPLGPNLTHEAQRNRTDQWQSDHIRNAIGVYVEGDGESINWMMQPYREADISDEDLHALVAYLQSLK